MKNISVEVSASILTNSGTTVAVLKKFELFEAAAACESCDIVRRFIDLNKAVNAAVEMLIDKKDLVSLSLAYHTSLDLIELILGLKSGSLNDKDKAELMTAAYTNLARA